VIYVCSHFSPYQNIKKIAASGGEFNPKRLNDASIQKEINDKILEANKKRTEAYKLEQEALTVLDEKVIYAH